MRIIAITERRVGYRYSGRNNHNFLNVGYNYTEYAYL